MTEWKLKENKAGPSPQIAEAALPKEPECSNRTLGELIL